MDMVIIDTIWVLITAKWFYEFRFAMVESGLRVQRIA